MRPYTVIAAAFALAPTIALAQSINCLCSSSTFLDDVTSCMVDQCSQDDLTAGISVGEQHRSSGDFLRRYFGRAHCCQLDLVACSNGVCGVYCKCDLEYRICADCLGHS
ncbi:hypothetical protein Rhopal_001704-T1 [Rhodotorula paludigena]|uniref:CFEM domain-containing protein n=1 Tax=Rhodotorula paludigena TaxID=86838 RepID=A0AAV5GF46_9BASI|nr:hypothetical protein Rhopal_001704-T1 [Rhodotorula paludigena]